MSFPLGRDTECRDILTCLWTNYNIQKGGPGLPPRCSNARLHATCCHAGLKDNKGHINKMFFR